MAKDRERRRTYAQSISKLNAYERHKKFIEDYVLFYGGPDALKTPQPAYKSDMDMLREEYRFVRTASDNNDSVWEKRVAKQYYDKLFKEYCIGDFSRFTEGKVRAFTHRYYKMTLTLRADWFAMENAKRGVRRQGPVRLRQQGLYRTQRTEELRGEIAVSALLA